MFGLYTAKRICTRLFSPYVDAADARRRAERAEAEASGMVDLYNEVHNENIRLQDELHEMTTGKH